MTKQLSPLEALRQIRVCHNLECGEDKSMNERLEIIETALKDYEMQKRIIKDLTASKNDLINERTKRIIERRAIYEDYNFQFLKRDVACKGCQYYKDEKCTNKDDCFWLELERKLTDYEKKSKVLEALKSEVSFFFDDNTITIDRGCNIKNQCVFIVSTEKFDLLKEELK